MARTAGCPGRQLARTRRSPLGERRRTENYYQHAKHSYGSMSRNRDGALQTLDAVRSQSANGGKGRAPSKTFFGGLLERVVS
jgi:hypothetical protein